MGLAMVRKCQRDEYFRADGRILGGELLALLAQAPQPRDEEKPAAAG
jgi:hypothetical protein